MVTQWLLNGYSKVTQRLLKGYLKVTHPIDNHHSCTTQVEKIIINKNDAPYHMVQHDRYVPCPQGSPPRWFTKGVLRSFFSTKCTKIEKFTKKIWKYQNFFVILRKLYLKMWIFFLVYKLDK